MNLQNPELSSSAASRILVRNPFSGDVVGDVPTTDSLGIERTLQRARAAWKGFRLSTPFQRKTLLLALADQIAGDAEDMARIICAEVGKTMAEARNEVRRAQNTLRLSAEAGTVVHGEIIPCAVVSGSPDKLAHVTYEPVGVVGAITPFNYPLNLLCHKLGPAIAAGNVVVAKPSPKAPLAAARLAELALKAGFPDGVFQVVYGGSEAAMTLARSQVDLLSFTGGPAAGLVLKNASGLVRCLMELGGNDPLIIMPDADLDRAAETALAHRFEIAGQSCAAAKKIYIHEAVDRKMLEKLGDRVGKVVAGNPFDSATTMGPVIDEVAAVEVERRIKAAVEAGAELKIGGDRHGAMITPTLLKNVPEETDLFATETFGPVIATRSFEDLPSLIELLNDSPYGLQAGLFTNDHSTIRKVSRELRVGGVMINEGPDFRAENVPFGGIKTSGLGREGIHFTIREMSELKVVID